MTALQKKVFWVFARRAPTDPIEQVGSVTAPTEAIAWVYAHINYRERAWRDMRVVAREAFYEPATETQ